MQRVIGERRQDLLLKTLLSLTQLEYSNIKSVTLNYYQIHMFLSTERPIQSSRHLAIPLSQPISAPTTLLVLRPYRGGLREGIAVYECGIYILENH